MKHTSNILKTYRNLNKKEKETIIYVIKALLYALINMIIWEITRPNITLIQFIILFISSVYIIYIPLEFRYRWG